MLMGQMIDKQWGRGSSSEDHIRYMSLSEDEHYCYMCQALAHLAL